MNNFEERRKHVKKRMRIRQLGMMGIIFMFMIAVIAISIPFNFNDHSYIITVTDKERVVSGSGEDISSKYLVFGDASDGESVVFENTDAFLRLKFNSSNIQGSLKEGHTYKITVVGIRVSFMSMYENILKVEEVTE